APADMAWGIGTARETWGGDGQTPDGAPGPTFETDIPSTSTDADAIAAAVLAALRGFCYDCGEAFDDPGEPFTGPADQHPRCLDCYRYEASALRSRGER